MGKFKLRLRIRIKGIYVVETWMYNGLILLGHSIFMLHSFFITAATTTTTTIAATTTTTATITSLAYGSVNLTNTRISIYRKATLHPGHVAFLILHNSKQSPYHPILEEL